MSTPQEAVTDEPAVFNVDVLKAIRMMFDADTKQLIPMYLTSWVGYTDSSDEWSPHSAFGSGASDLIENFEEIVPPSFDRTKFGATWYAPNDWIEKERKAYYIENPGEVPRWEEAKRNNRIEKKKAEKERNKGFVGPMPVYRHQEVENVKIYKKYLAELSPQPFPPKQNKKSKTLVVSSAKEGKLIPTMRFRKVATIDTPRGPTVLSSHKIQTLSKSGTRSSTPAMRQALKQKQPVTRPPSNSPNDKEGKRKHDSLFTDSESDNADDDVPLAQQVKHKSAAQNTEADDSDSDVPLWTLIPKPASSTLASALKPVLMSPTNPRLKNYSPISAKANAWDQVNQLRPLGRNRPVQVASLPPVQSMAPNKPPSLTVQTSTSLPSTNSYRIEAVVPSEPDVADPILDDEPRHDSPMEIDNGMSLMNPISFLESVVENVSVAPIERIAWEPITLMLDSGKGMEKFCQVSLQKVTRPQSPPNLLKWIHRSGFKINSIRALYQLDLLLRKFEPWQHAQLAGQDQQDNENLATFAAYLSQTNMFALADTDDSKVKLCFHASDMSFSADRMGIPAYSELIQGPLHLIVTVIKAELAMASSSASLLDRRIEEHDEWYRPPLNLVYSPKLQRGFRTLRFPLRVKEMLQGRAQGYKSYFIFTPESLAFRYGNPVNIDKLPETEHSRYKIDHREETRALQSIMQELAFTPKPPSLGTATVVFIHNAAWDMLKHLPGLHDRKSRIRNWFFCYGPHHALEPHLWGVREVFKRGGIMTFTASAILDSPSRFMQVLECIKNSSEIWLAYITPVVIGSLQASAIHNPEDERTIMTLLAVLEAVKTGMLSIFSAPPKPWKIDEWSKWIAASLELGLPPVDSTDSDEVVLDAAEKALEAAANPVPSPTPPACGCTFPSKMDPDVPMKHYCLSGTALDEAVDRKVFEDLRQMMLIPVLHTEYRHFVVIRDPHCPRLAQREAKYPLEVRDPDSIAHYLFSALPDLDKPAFGSLRTVDTVDIDRAA